MKTRQLFRIMVLVLMSLLFVVACGGQQAGTGDGATTGNAGTGAAASPAAGTGGDTAASPAAGAGAAAGSPIDVTVAVGGQGSMVYLPTTLAQQLGYYEEEGLNVTIQDFQGGSKALQALLGGSTDVVSGFYDHTIQMAAEDRDLTSFVTMLRYPGLVLVVSPATQKQINSIADLQGATVGVSAPGSSTDLFLKYLLSKEGLPADAASVTGIGLTADAVAAVERGQVDAAVMLEPAVTQLQERVENVNILADTRTAEGVQEVFGTDTYPASVLYSTDQWLEQNPEAAARLARAIKRSLEWIQQHSPEEIAQQMPESFRGENPELYVQAIEHMMPTFSPDGVMEAEGPDAVKEVLSLSLESVRNADVDTSQTFTNEFVTQ